jgi:ABC-2 type transport system ATP-binding protein
MYEAEQLCDRIFMIHQGRKVLDATLAEIRSRFDPRTIIAEPVTDRAAAAAALERLPGVHSVMHDAGSKAQSRAEPLVVRLEEDVDAAAALASIAVAVPMRRVELKRVTLEDVFFQLVGATPDDVAMKTDGEETPADGPGVREAAHA